MPAVLSSGSVFANDDGSNRTVDPRYGGGRLGYADPLGWCAFVSTRFLEISKCVTGQALPGLHLRRATWCANEEDCLALTIELRESRMAIGCPRVEDEAQFFRPRASSHLAHEGGRDRREGLLCPCGQQHEERATTRPMEEESFSLRMCLLRMVW
jgi:hypothetical protein